MSLVTLEEVKNYLNIDPLNLDYDSYLNSEIVLFSNTVENYCNRKFELKTYTEKFYRQDFIDSQDYYLYHFPVTSISNIQEKDNNGLVEDLDYRLNKKTGLLNVIKNGIKNYLFNNTGNSGYIEIEYEAGYSEIPKEIKECIFNLIQGRFNKKESGVDFNFGNNVQRINLPGVMGIDFDYTLSTNDRKNKYGMLLGDWQNVLDFFVSERTMLGETSIKYVE